MNFFLIVFLIVFTSCSTGEDGPQYPDGLKQSSEIIDSHGCGNVFVYQFIDSSRAIVVTIDASKVNLTQEKQSINLDNQQDIISLRLEEAGSSADSVYFNYCNDIAWINQGEVKTYPAKEGIVTFSVSEDNPIKDPIWKSDYQITIEALDLHFYDGNTNLKLHIDKIIFWDVNVGWLPG